LRHEGGREVIQQWQTEQQNQKCGSAGDREFQLPLHQAVEKFFTVDEIVVFRSGI